MITAKPLLKDKIWVLEENGEKIGTLQQAEDGITLISGKTRIKFGSTVELKRKFSISFADTKRESREKSVYDFPTATVPYNDMYDVQRNLPIFTKNAKSKSFFCAGHYALRMNNRWKKVYCPKLLLLSRYEFLGPFKTTQVADDAISNQGDLRR